MNSRIILAGLTIAVLSSCSTAYKAQTPDDVYYSPAKPQDEYVHVETKKDREEYRGEEEYSDDRYLRWKVRNRSRWSSFDDYGNDWYDNRYGGWSYNPYWNRNTYWSANTYWNNYWYWNNNYNPYCGRVIVVNPKTPVYRQQVRNYKPGTYNNTYNTTNSAVRKTSPGVYRPTGSYNNSNRSNSNSLGNSLKKVFNNSNSNNSSYDNNSDSRPSRTYSPPSNNSSSNSSGTRSSGSSGSNSGGGVSRPGRGG